MARLKSKIPSADDLDPEMFRYLEDLDRRIPAMSDLDAAATAATIVTTVNNLMAALRTAGIMEQ